jgi:glycosyltransferase involved in cell wall biosynthesis
MKLMQTMAGGAVGGAEEFFVRLAVAFDEAGVDQRIVARPNDTRNKKITAVGAQLSELPFGGLLDFKTAGALAREIDEFTPDVVLSWMSRASRFSGKAFRQSTAAPVLIGRLGGYYKMKYFSQCDHLIGNTPDIVRYLVDNGWPAERAHFVPNFVASMPGRTLAREDLDVPVDVPLLLAAGRLHTNKAFDVLLQAMPKTRDAHLMIAGDGDEEAALKAQTEALGIEDRVRFLGWRGDMPDLLATADMLVCPSRIEPLGNVVLEAWAYGVPLVAAASIGPGWLVHHEQDGLLVAVEDHAELADAISRLCDDRGFAENLADAGRRRYEAEFTQEEVVRQFLELFQRVCR